MNGDWDCDIDWPKNEKPVEKLFLINIKWTFLNSTTSSLWTNKSSNFSITKEIAMQILNRFFKTNNNQLGCIMLQLIYVTLEKRLSNALHDFPITFIAQKLIFNPIDYIKSYQSKCIDID